MRTDVGAHVRCMKTRVGNTYSTITVWSSERLKAWSHIPRMYDSSMLGPNTRIDVESSLKDRYWECENVWCRVAISEDVEIAGDALQRGGTSIFEKYQANDFINNKLLFLFLTFFLYFFFLPAPAAVIDVFVWSL